MPHHPLIAWTLWFIGSFLGLHHLYLHRPHAAFLSVITLQAGGLLWFYDFLHLSQLVAQANAQDEYIAHLRVLHTFHPQPPLSLLVSLIQIVIGTVFGWLATCLVPAQWPDIVYEVLFAVGTAWGVTFSGNAVDLETHGELQRVVLTLVIMVVMVFGYYGGNVENDDYRSIKAATSFVGTGVYLLTRRWSPRVDALLNQNQAIQEEQDEHKRVKPSPAYWRTFLTFWGLLTGFVGCATTAVVFHGVVRLEIDGVVTETPFFEACHNVLQSDAFQMFKTTMHDLYHGKPFDAQYRNKWTEFRTIMDVSGRYRYLKVLGVSKEASEKEVRAAYRTLVLQWHPDKYRGDNVDHAKRTFMEIQEAYEKLTGERSDSGRGFSGGDEL